MIYSHIKRSEDLPISDVFLFKVFMKYFYLLRVEYDLLGKIQQTKEEED